MTVQLRVVVILFAAAVAIVGPILNQQRSAAAQKLKKNPTPQDYVERKGGARRSW